MVGVLDEQRTKRDAPSLSVDAILAGSSGAYNQFDAAIKTGVNFHTLTEGPLLISRYMRGSAIFRNILQNGQSDR
jgi:hypothetical protein